MFPGQRRPEKIWILRDWTETADRFRLSALPVNVDDVIEFRRFIKEHYRENYSSATADNIIIKDNVTGAILPGATRLVDLAGNTEETPYPVFVKGSSSHLISLIFKATQQVMSSCLLDTGSYSLRSSASRRGPSISRKGMMPSSPPLSPLLSKNSMESTRQAKKSGSEMGGELLRRRYVAVSDKKDEPHNE